MMILLVVILGVVVFLANAMMKSASKASEGIETKTDSIVGSSSQGAYGIASGGFCASDADCASGSCNSVSYKCD